MDILQGQMRGEKERNGHPGFHFAQPSAGEAKCWRFPAIRDRILASLLRSREVRETHMQDRQATSEASCTCLGGNELLDVAEGFHSTASLNSNSAESGFPSWVRAPTPNPTLVATCPEARDHLGGASASSPVRWGKCNISS